LTAEACGGVHFRAASAQFISSAPSTDQSEGQINPPAGNTTFPCHPVRQCSLGEGGRFSLKSNVPLIYF